MGSASLLSFFYSLKNVTQRYLNLKMQFFFPGPPHCHSLTTCSVHPLANCQPQRLASHLISSIPAPRLLSILEEKRITGLMTVHLYPPASAGTLKTSRVFPHSPVPSFMRGTIIEVTAQCPLPAQLFRTQLPGCPHRTHPPFGKTEVLCWGIASVFLFTQEVSSS